MTESKIIIIRNRAKCKLCGDVIESKHRHDWVKCKCGEIFTDGGHDYFHRGANNFENLIDMSEIKEEFKEIDS